MRRKSINSIFNFLERMEYHPELSDDKTVIWVNFANLTFCIMYIQEEEEFELIFDLHSDPLQAIETIKELERGFGQWEIMSSVYY